MNLGSPDVDRAIIGECWADTLLILALMFHNGGIENASVDASGRFTTTIVR